MADPSLQALSDSPVLNLRDWISTPAMSSSSLHPGVTRSSGGGSGDGHGTSYSSLAVPATLPNVLLAPLTVIIHIAQYSHYLDGLSPADAEADSHAYTREGFAAGSVSHTPDTGIGTASQFQGLCIGMLSATAMELSATRTELGQNAAAAVRLAMCIGGYIDSERGLAMSGSKYNSSFSLDSVSDMVCFIARWGVDSGREHLEAILSRYSEVRCIVCGSR
jgi:hypothetical protein